MQFSEEPSDFSATVDPDRSPSPVGLETMRRAEKSAEESEMRGGALTSQPSNDSVAAAAAADALASTPDSLAEIMATPSTKEQLMAKQRREADEKHAKMEAEIKAAVERRRQEKMARADAKFKAMFDSVMEGIEGEGILAEVDDALQKAENAKARRAASIHHEWNETVFKRIQEQIMHYVDNIDPEALTKRLAYHYDAFLDTVNTKQEKNYKSGVFRDVLLVHEYDPLMQRKDVIKYRVDPLDDPTKRDVYKTLKEKLAVGLLKEAVARSGVTMRETLDTLHWTNLEATPYGRFTNEDGELRPQTVGPYSLKRGESHVVMDAYNVPTGKAVTDAEFPLPKAQVSLAGHRLAQTDMLDLVNHRVDPTDGTTGGDQWLEAKGKKFTSKDMPMAGLSKERKDLFDVINMCSDPNDKRPQGDQWLSARGKKVVLPPSVIYSDRKSLHETIQQSAPKFVRERPDQTCGDLWLDAKGKGEVNHLESGAEGGLYAVIMQTEQPL